MSETAEHFIYKITTKQVWDHADPNGVLEGMPIDRADGFMHFSTAEQLRETLSLHFKGQHDLVLLAVPVAAVVDGLKWEPSRGGVLFPHLYAELPLSAVAWARPVSVSDNGVPDMPALS